jgi:hypothetical protein
MGNLRSKYTDEEWEKLEKETKDTQNVASKCPRCDKFFKGKGTYCSEKCLKEDLPF